MSVVVGSAMFLIVFSIVGELVHNACNAEVAKSSLIAQTSFYITDGEVS